MIIMYTTSTLFTHCHKRKSVNKCKPLISMFVCSEKLKCIYSRHSIWMVLKIQTLEFAVENKIKMTLTTEDTFCIHYPVNIRLKLPR